jgi:hypothetical protein
LNCNSLNVAISKPEPFAYKFSRAGI